MFVSNIHRPPGRALLASIAFTRRQDRQMFVDTEHPYKWFMDDYVHVSPLAREIHIKYTDLLKILKEGSYTAYRFPGRVRTRYLVHRVVAAELKRDFGWLCCTIREERTGRQITV